MERIIFSDIDKKCLNCGKKLEIKNSRDITRKKFCSRKCNGFNHGKDMLSDPDFRNKFLNSSRNDISNSLKGLRGEVHPAWVDRENRSCKYCESIFECRKNSKRKYCSRKCSLDHIHIRNMRDRVLKREYQCVICGTSFLRSVNYKQNPKYCSYKCNGIDRCISSRKTKTDIEHKICDILNSMNIDFSEQVNIKNISVADFAISNLLIFADGDYWHDLPGRKESDVLKTERLELFGYKVLRFRGSVIKKDPEFVKKEIIKFLP